MIQSIIIISICIILSAVFSGMEIAYLSANRLRIELDKKQGSFSSTFVSIFINNASLYITTLLIANNLVLVIYGIFIAQLLEPIIAQHIVNVPLLIMLIQTIISATIILITAEFIPKSIFRRSSNQWLSFFSFPIYLFYIIFYPISLFTLWISKLIIRFFYKNKNEQKDLSYVFSKIDLDHFLSNQNNDDKIVIDHEIKFFQNALDFSNLKVRDCMIPRTDIVAIDQKQSITDLKNKFIDSGFSKIIVFHNNIDNISGYVSLKEIYKNPSSIKSILISPPIVPNTMPVNKLLQKLLSEHKSMAIVVDEFGGTSGIITVEDIIEQIFGEIEDEHDTPELIDKQINEETYVFSGKIEIDFVNEKYKLNILESEDYDTIAGYISHKIGKIPTINEIFDIDEFNFKIIKASRNKIDLIYLKKNK